MQMRHVFCDATRRYRGQVKLSTKSTGLTSISSRFEFGYTNALTTVPHRFDSGRDFRQTHQKQGRTRSAVVKKNFFNEKRAIGLGSRPGRGSTGVAEMGTSSPFAHLVASPFSSSESHRLVDGSDRVSAQRFSGLDGGRRG
jgi:hypothetical protein